MNKYEAIKALAALSQETRLDIFRLLAKVGPSGLPAGVIASELDVLQSSLSPHLSVLSAVGLIDRDSGRSGVFYRARLADFLDELITEEQSEREAVCIPWLDAIAT
jgi:DNA-binding transcriptional ArsR family regulator